GRRSFGHFDCLRELKKVECHKSSFRVQRQLKMQTIRLCEMICKRIFRIDESFFSVYKIELWIQKFCQRRTLRPGWVSRFVVFSNGGRVAVGRLTGWGGG